MRKKTNLVIILLREKKKRLRLRVWNKDGWR